MKVFRPIKIAGLILLALACIVTLAGKFTVAPAAQVPGTKTILVYGDSISAAYGMKEHEGWVALLAEWLAQELPHYQVVNASVSGETSSGGITRLAKTLEATRPDIFILELGGNDGLRGYPIDRIQQNLGTIIQGAQDAGASVLLMGMVLPPNYGRRYVQSFAGIFPALAERHQLDYVPAFDPWQAIGEDGTSTLLQDDGIHPTAEAQYLLLDQVWRQLAPMLQ